jgi:hypothetical protein
MLCILSVAIPDMIISLFDHFSPDLVRKVQYGHHNDYKQSLSLKMINMKISRLGLIEPVHGVIYLIILHLAS